MASTGIAGSIVFLAATLWVLLTLPVVTGAPETSDNAEVAGAVAEVAERGGDAEAAGVQGEVSHEGEPPPALVARQYEDPAMEAPEAMVAVEDAAALEASAVMAAVADAAHRAINEDAVVAAVESEAEDAILDRILESVLGDVPEPRAGVNRNTWVVSGKATDGWASFNSITDGSFGGGLRDFFGAGGSVVIQGDNFGRIQDRMNALHPGFGTSGNWLTQPRQSKQTHLKSSQTNERKLITQLWASVILRDNIVTVFGYILNIPNNPLSTDLYTSLYYVYDAVRLRRIPTFELIRSVEKLGRLNSNGQFLVLFSALRNVVPNYMKSAVDVWIQKCQSEFNLLDKILRPGGGPLVVDFLAGIDASIIEVLSENIKWDHSTPRDNPNVKALMGASVFEDIFTALSEGTLELSQQLFAILLINRPTNDVVAQKDETERYLVDVLRLENVPSWEKIIKNITSTEKRDPDKLIRTLLRLISECKETDRLIRDDARYLRPYIKSPTVTYANKYYDTISGVISKPSLDLISMLKVITPREYPHYIIMHRNRLMEFIFEGQLNVEFIIKGFNRFDHVSPVNLLIAIFTRISRRLHNLPMPIVQSVKSLQLFLIYKKFFCTMSPRIPVHLIDTSAFIGAFDDPLLSENITVLVSQLANSLPEENIPWGAVAKRVPLHRCVRPRQCIYNILCLLINKKYVSKGRVNTAIRKLIKLLDGDGNPRENKLKKLPEAYQNARVTNERAEVLSLPGMGDSWPLVADNFSGRKRATPSDDVFLTEIQNAVIKSRTTPFPPLSGVQQEEPALTQYPATCLQPTLNGTTEYEKVLPAHMLLSWERLPTILGDNFRAENYVKKGELLLAIMEELSKKDIIKRFPEVHIYVQSFIQFIQSFQKRFKADSVVYFPSLLNALPAVSNPEERQHTAKLRNYFTNAEFYKQLGQDFDPRLHKTRGEMLKYVLGLMLKKQMLKWDPALKEAVTYYIDKVYIDGYGAQEVEWALLSEASEPTYVDMTVFRVLDHTKMPQNALMAEYEILKFIFTDFIPNIHLRDLNVRKFKTKAQFLKGTFEYLLSQQSVNPRIKEDIQLLMQYIRMDGRGAEPLDYNAEMTDM